MKGKITKEKSNERKKEKCWKKKCETKKGLKKQRCFFLGAVFFLFVTKKCREKKDEQGISKKQFKNKKDYLFHTLFSKTNKQENTKSKKNGRKRKSRRCLHQCFGWKTTFFQIHHNRQAKNAKTGETIFQDTET